MNSAPGPAIRLSSRPLIILFALVLGLAPSCSKKSNPAAPYGGGGGGGGATVESFDSGVFSSGNFPHTFTNAGTFRYHCSIHGTQTSGMNGDIMVGTGMPATATVNIGNNSFAPTPAHVDIGGTVTWVSNGTSHTVTRP